MRSDLSLRRLLIALPALLALLGGCAGSGKKPDVTDSEIRSGLRAALKQGVMTTAGMVPGSGAGGPFPALFPKPLKRATAALKTAGMGGLADRFTALMNSGVDGLIQKGGRILFTAIERLPLKDARAILLGGETALTDHFRKLTRKTLLAAFGREIRAVLEPIGAANIWKKAAGFYNTLPLGRQINPDLTAFLADEALKRLFAGIADVEKRIRRDIRARTDDVLKRVFGLQDRR